jgi:hypothetical protein
MHISYSIPKYEAKYWEFLGLFARHQAQ